VKYGKVRWVKGKIKFTGDISHQKHFEVEDEKKGEKRKKGNGLLDQTRGCQKRATGG